MQTLTKLLGDVLELDIKADETLLRQLEDKLGAAGTKELLQLVSLVSSDGGWLERLLAKLDQSE